MIAVFVSEWRWLIICSWPRYIVIFGYGPIYHVIIISVRRCIRLHTLLCPCMHITTNCSGAGCLCRVISSHHYTCICLPVWQSLYAPDVPLAASREGPEAEWPGSLVGGDGLGTCTDTQIFLSNPDISRVSLGCDADVQLGTFICFWDIGICPQGIISLSFNTIYRFVDIWSSVSKTLSEDSFNSLITRVAGAPTSLPFLCPVALVARIVWLACGCEGLLGSVGQSPVTRLLWLEAFNSLLPGLVAFNSRTCLI